MTKLLIVAAAIASLFAACGGEDQKADRNVRIEMSDIEFSIETLDVTKGETVKFEFTNSGKLDHDAFIGDEAAQTEHEASMRSGDSGHDHSGSDAITVQPGRTRSLTYTFDEPGEIIVGCHETGHYDAGMKIVVTVA